MAVYENAIRVLLGIMIIFHISKHDYKKILPAIFAILLTFIPWLAGLFKFQINTLTEVLFQAIVLMTVYLGSGLKWYDRFSVWDRTIHFLSGILVVSLGITLAGKAPDAGLPGTLIFSFTLSLTVHVFWEIIEYAHDCFFRSNHQRWQKVNANINHQPPKAVQPPGLVDTMNDTIACLIGTASACMGWWVALAL